jgi:hypothetical protein
METEELLMENYIVCEGRANHSRIHVKICQHRCQDADTCRAFQDYVKAHLTEAMEKRSESVSWPQEKLVSPTAA